MNLKAKPKFVDGRNKIKLKYDPTLDGNFTDFGIDKFKIFSGFEKNFKNLVKPTPSQRRILSVLNSKISCVNQNKQGTGNSFALVLYALSLEGLHGEVSSLIIVQNELLVKQYKEIFDKFLQNYPKDKDNKVQYLYRSDEMVELEQETLLSKITPHILVSTPHRLLDIICKHPDDPNYIHLKTLKFLACDDADTLLIDHGKKINKKRATEILIDYINDLREKVVNNPPLQYCFMSSVDITDKVMRLVTDKKWAADRPILPIGIPSLKSYRFEPAKRLPNYISISPILVTSSKNHQERIKFFDLKTSDLANNLESIKKIRSPVGKEFDENYKRYRVKNRGKLPKILLDSLPQFLENSNSKSEKALLIVPENVSSLKISNYLKEKFDIFAEPINQLEFSKLSNLFVSTDMETQFSALNPQFVIATSAQVAGLTLPGLKKIVCLGIDSVVDSSSLVLLGGRFRLNENGLINDEHYNTTDKLRSIEGEANISLLYPKSAFSIIERYAFERIILKSGIIKIHPLMNEFEPTDLSTYKELFEEDGDIFEKLQQKFEENMKIEENKYDLFSFRNEKGGKIKSQGPSNVSGILPEENE
ncbi:hypothetical protein PACTADRAFT_35255 [Pachysolen tannophilus NRRL Y-2460]|uniref:ATP-dependent RNA helicase n=1 Tax=Pachysolen tannophilus NRRL Y-2460 TaxID=669874 RepID=A0A1E4TRR2_PACTA|nr:hypothetical protein PACTADRAFT_35255 [Pachysolen tannophilus NRRL Y-2460]